MEQQDVESQQELQDPQDTAPFSTDMAEAQVEQREVACKSVYEALVEIGKCHGKLYRTGGRHADMMGFDLVTHSVFVGNTFIIQRGVSRIAVLETASVKILIEGLPWLTKEEAGLDPVDLFRDHYLSRPNGSEKFVRCNFPAADVDDLTDDQVISAMPRHEARVRLEAWMLCASMDGTLFRYVTRKPNFRRDSFFWSPETGDAVADRLVIHHDWWLHSTDPVYRLNFDRGDVLVYRGPVRIATLDEHRLNEREMRTFQMAEELRRTLSSLANETFRLQLRTKRDDCDALLNDANRILRYIDRGAKAENA